MTARTGLGVLEVAALSAVAEVGAVAGASRRATSEVLEVLERESGIAARYAYPLLQDLAAPWRLHLPLLDGAGSWGSQRGDRPGDAHHTEVRLTEVGALALAAEREQVGPVPLGLIEGSLYRDGPVPPFDPARVVRALQSGGQDAGGPVLPTGGTVEGDLEALLSGGRTRLRLACSLEREPSALCISAVPLGVRVDDVEHALSSAASGLRPRRYADYLAAEPEETAPPSFGVVDVQDESSGRDGVRVLCTLTPGSDVDAAERWARAVWPVTVEVDCRLPAPMTDRLRQWDAGDGSGLDALARLLPG